MHDSQEHLGRHDPEGAPAKRKNASRRDRRPTPGAAAAERASAGVGTVESDPTAWLFGDSLSDFPGAPARPY
jgi:hypothetical protein